MDNSFNGISNKMSETMFYRFPHIDVLFSKIPDNLYNYLLDECEKIKCNFKNYKSYNHQLAGHIKNEYDLNHCLDHVSEFVEPFASKYLDDYKFAHVVWSNNINIKLKSLWVNYQKKYEFNPPHDHSGIISFVMWIKIPYNLKDEMKVFSNGKFDQTSKFCFLTLSQNGKINSIPVPVDKSYEGLICFFPSTMTHYVNPFYTSDDYRISISGNLYVEDCK